MVTTRIVLIIAIFLQGAIITIICASPVDNKDESFGLSQSAFIVGGSLSTPGDFPYFVDLGNTCGATLIAPDTILSAGHCTNYMNNTQVHIGAYNRSIIAEGSQERFCEEWWVDPLYLETYQALYYDFALCKLNEPVYIDTSFVSLELNENEDLPAVGDELIVMGLGLETEGGGYGDLPDALRNVTVPYVGSDTCNLPDWYDGVITDDLLCAGFEDGGKDSCGGDSGGPIVQRIYQEDGTFRDTHMGVVSWGDGCARPKRPGVYARTSHRMPWIKSIVCDEFKSIASFCSNSPPPDPPCGQELLIRVKTDNYPRETSIRLRDDSTGSDVLVRKYMIEDYQNEHRLCLEENTCYKFYLEDMDGIINGSYELILNGEQIKDGNGNFQYQKTEDFCTSFGPPSVSPTESPCVDDPDFRYKGDETKDCDYFLRSNSKRKIRKKCRKKTKRIKVKEWCPETCGRKGAIGKCKHLFDPSN